jgi:hypothetical protein
MFEEDPSVDMKASNNSFGAVVEKVELAERVLALVMSWELTASTVIPARAETANEKSARTSTSAENTIRFASIPMIRAMDSCSFAKQYKTPAALPVYGTETQSKTDSAEG